ncbi:MAG: hypothetical protein MJ082_06445 [Clostridia bacterium]|nr:hypothetical protein [Clostridia bacterium]
MNNERIAVLFGGQGAERDVSVVSARAVIRAALKCKFQVFPVCIEKNGDFLWERPTGERIRVFPVKYGEPCFLAENGEKIFVDTVFPILHGDFGEDGTVQGLLSSAGFSVLGVDTHAGAITSDKCATKLIAKSLGIPVLDGCLIPAGTSAAFAFDAVKTAFPQGAFPLFLKPNRLGSSVGAVAVPEESEFAKRYETCAKYGDVLAEPMLTCPEEWEVAYLSRFGREYFGPGRITVRKGFYDFKTKYESAEARVEDTPDLPTELSARSLAYAKRLVETVGIRDLCRVDFFRVGDDIFFNEINPIPGMTEISMSPRVLRAGGLSFSDLVRQFGKRCHDRRV